MRLLVKYLRIFFSPVLWIQCVRAIRIFLHGNVYGIINAGAVGRGTSILPSAQLAFSHNIFLGEQLRINRYVFLWAGENSTIHIGDYAALGPHVFVTSKNYGIEQGTLYSDQEPDEADVVIGKHVWIGAHAVILPGVTIGDGAVVAAGAVVTKDVAPNTVVAGVPARQIKDRPKRIAQSR